MQDPQHKTAIQHRLEAALASGAEAAVNTVDLLLAEADRLGASDVHFQPALNGLDVRFRIDGVLTSIAALPREMTHRIIARLKVMAELLTYRTDVPQEGSIRGDSSVDRRVSTFPTVHGENAIVRVFNPSAGLLDLEQLGLPGPVQKSLENLLQQRSGAIFLTGPSGSGKTTTIYALLRRLATEEIPRHIVTIEDPVERILDGVSQSQVRPGTDFDFARGLRSLLRQDPEVLMVGEVRDRETAAIAIEAALTGHLLFTTLHAGSACGVIGRLLEMGVEPYLLTAGIRAIVNQRLLRQLCAACHGRTQTPPCDSCGGTGYRGRFLIAELLLPSPEFRKGILAHADTDQLEAIARKEGMADIRQSAEQAVAAGRTLLVEVERALGPRV